MSSARNQPDPAYPAVPPSDHELRNYYANQPETKTPPSTIPYYTPYLGLRARLSQVWINRWTVLLALIICRTLIAVTDINHSIGQAKTQALSACSSVENVGSAMASMPHYLSGGVNALAAEGVTNAVNGLMDMLMLSITGVEEIVLFVINLLTSTYVCLITLAVSGSLHVAIDMIEKVGKFMNESISELTDDITKGVSSFTDNLNSFLSGLSDVTGLFGGSKDPPTIDLSSSIKALNSIQIDTDALDSDLTKLNNSIPTFAEVQNFTDNLIRLPFEEVKKLINSSIADYTFDKSVFPLAEKQTLTFCTDNNSIVDFFDGLTKTLRKSRTIFLVVLVILAVLVCIPMAYREIWRWRTMQQRSILLQKHSFDPMDVIYIASRPYTTSAGIKAASKVKSTKNQILVRWAFAYATSIPALFVLALGIAGLLACLCQYIVLRVIQHEVPKLANQVGDFADTVVGALDDASTAWAVSANSVINNTNTQVNNDVFGWVNTTTSAVNNTLNAFSDEMSSVLNTTFGGTILYDPIKGVLNCLIEIKIIGIQKGLTWVSDHAHITFPQFRKDVFSLGAAASITDSSSAESFLSSPGSEASDDITGAILKVANFLEEGIRTEALISTALVGIWVLIALIGLGRVLVAMMGRDKTRAEGGPVGYTGDNRAPLSPRSPNRNDASRFPQFGGPVSSVHPMTSSDDMWGANAANEKVGHVGHRSVEASVKPGHERVSSYGYLDGNGNEKR
ncbi:plasma membrane fusion protein prm1 [Phlyctema vagabunda]|uniref:Plasma membrane fusion protein PRM1 n=1 Tax=Phlyctema vagabunda TaxID=108571 RepID=A0ABR4PV82_9HELO